MTATEIFELAVNCYLRELDDAEWTALTRRVRPPKAPVRRTSKRRIESGVS